MREINFPEKDKPLREDVKYIEAISQGALSNRLEERSDDEFGQLGKAVNAIVGGLEEIVDFIATIAKGELEGSDVTITSDRESAVGIAKGELNTQMAFMTGKIKVAGNLAVLMMHQNIITQWANLAENLDTEY